MGSHPRYPEGFDSLHIPASERIRKQATRTTAHGSGSASSLGTQRGVPPGSGSASSLGTQSGSTRLPSEDPPDSLDGRGVARRREKERRRSSEASSDAIFSTRY